MPRVLKADLMVENKTLKNDLQHWRILSERATSIIDDLEEEVQMWKLATNEWQHGAFEAQESLHAAQEELKKVRQELSDRKDRDRSPRRLSTATSRRNLEQTCKHSALNHVLAWERDSVIDEQREVIARQQQEIQESDDCC